MSANNAIVVIPIRWTFPAAVSGGKVEKWATRRRFLIFHGDMDQASELTSTGVVTKELLWYAFQNNAKMKDSKKEAMWVAKILASWEMYIEYGTQILPELKYEEAWG